MCLSCLMLLDWGFLCEGLRLDFPQQSKGFNLMHVLKCIISVPLTETESDCS